MTPNSFGGLLRQLRIASRRTMRDVATQLNFSVSYLSDVERGNRAPLTTEKILQVAQYLRIAPNLLLCAAATTKGVFQLPATTLTAEQAELGARLTLRWSSLTPAQVAGLLAVLTSEAP